MAGLVFIPKIVYNSTTLALTQPQKLWSPKSQPVGGGNVSDSGVPEAFIVRRDQMVSVEVRFTESEWTGVDAWIAWGQGGGAFDYWFDKNDAATSRTCYLVSPALGVGEVAPIRDSYRFVYSLQVIMRSTTNTLIDVRV